jgi:hypothetical protein
LKENYGFDESNYPKPGDEPDRKAERSRNANKKAMRAIVRKVLWTGNEIKSHSYGVVAMGGEKRELNYDIRNVIGEETIKEKELTHCE